MSFQAEVLNVFIASPSDVAVERDEVEQAVYQWNRRYSENLNIILLPKRWEKDTFPAHHGEDPQQIINEQLINNCDILVGIFWTKMGTPTLKHKSGTLEEIQIFIDQNKDVMVYFVQKDVPRDNKNYEDMARVDEFKEKYGNSGLYSDYDKDKVINHLYQVVLKRVKQEKNVHDSNVTKPSTTAVFNESRLEKLIRTKVLFDEEILLLAYSRETGHRDFVGFNDPEGMYTKLKKWSKLSPSQVTSIAKKYKRAIDNLVERELLFKDSDYPYKTIKNHKLHLDTLDDLRSLSPVTIDVINDIMKNYK
ncbi:hypothetical protein PAT3040_02667 [Paenibacillus agaridevorans]|uniref:DUF4062 domain-containing protein n=1 Tax=Paenibacillus agaridevorans TaxID=171404 RepID=A0A2R5EN53_9BACL|nr:DUF4062 domain-containing protein [Paenibacillus agaridevorans]GBG08100.1 hypothetical protein PAT3040_02667 [Paenibacillus agaridevorans]